MSDTPRTLASEIVRVNVIAGEPLTNEYLLARQVLDLERELDSANERIAELEQWLKKASQLCSICSDWNLLEVEIDREMVDIDELKEQFDAVRNSAKGSDD